MEKEKRRKIGMAACILVMCLGVIALAVYLLFGENINTLFNEEESTTEQTEVVYEQPISVSGPSQGLSAVWLEYGTDFTKAEEIVPALQKIYTWGFRSVVFSGFEFDMIPAAVTAAKNTGLYTVAKISAADILAGGLADEQSVKQLVDSGIESVLIDFDSSLSERENQVAAKAVRKASDKVYLGIYSVAADEYSSVCNAGIFDYKYVDIMKSSSEIKGDLTAYLNNYIDGTTAQTVFGMHVELVGNAKGYEKPDEILVQLQAVSQLASDGFGFYRYAVLEKNENSVTDAITEYMSTGIMKDFFKELIFSKPSKTVFETSESKVSFVGTGDITQKLTFNGESVEMIDDGYFAFDAGLNPGKNTFTFEHKGKIIKYEVTYKPVLIKSVQPKGTMNAPGGASLDISAFALKTATVTAVINGTSVPMVRSDSYGEEQVVDAASDYSYFIGSYLLPESKNTVQNLGKIQVTASYAGQTQTVSGASVSVNAEEIEQPTVIQTQTTVTVTETTQQINETTSQDTSEGDSSSESGESSITSSTDAPATTTTQEATQPGKVELFEQLTPDKYNGVSGKSKMVIVNCDYAETLPATTTSDISYPYYTPLPRGTVDYIKSTVSYSGINYYVLRSGRRVYQKQVKYIDSGYNMPANEIRTVGVRKTTDSTDITLTLKWRVPFNVRENPQSYYTQTQGRPYSVKSLTAEYVDIVFYYTNTVDTAPQFSSNVISRATWIDGSDGTKTLRLFLKNKGCFYGIKYFYNSDGTLTLSIKERNSTAISGKVVMLDAGHGGSDPGAIGAVVVGSSNVHEATINLSIANKMKAKLEALGATVIMTRTSSGQTISLDERVVKCRNANPDIFVAVHCDSSESSSPSGTTAYYYKSYAYPLAKYIGAGIVNAYKKTVYASNSTMAARVDKGTNVMAFRVTRVEECPAVLIEFGFVSNVVECKALTVDSNQDALAQGAVNGIVDYFKNS
ncbi:MAG: N-acetylmuramoyl-L-alanine amidase [Clostridia bacterium]|nr:N-acetylmuramoyl-L-alanine amidase [Clostridia bacterium]